MKYRILNLDETGRFWIDDFKIPEGWELSDPFDTIEAAEIHADSLKETNRQRIDQHFSVLGIYVKNDHYPQVVYKCNVSFS